MSERTLRVNCLVDRDIHPELYDDLVQCDPRKRADRLRFLAALAARGAASGEPSRRAPEAGASEDSQAVDEDGLDELLGGVSFS
ncbi:MAG: hypothetical protein ACOC0J_01745 [Myxococcota bacterium]